MTAARHILNLLDGNFFGVPFDSTAMMLRRISGLLDLRTRANLGPGSAAVPTPVSTLQAHSHPASWGVGRATRQFSGTILIDTPRRSARFPGGSSGIPARRLPHGTVPGHSRIGPCCGNRLTAGALWKQPAAHSPPRARPATP